MAVVATKQDRPATEADLLALPEHGRGYELIDGALVEKQSGFRHGRAQVRVARLLGPYDRRSGEGDRPGGWWFLTEQLVRFASGHTLRPDVSGWLRERLPEPAGAVWTLVSAGAACSDPAGVVLAIPWPASPRRCLARARLFSASQSRCLVPCRSP